MGWNWGGVGRSEEEQRWDEWKKGVKWSGVAWRGVEWSGAERQCERQCERIEGNRHTEV